MPVAGPFYFHWIDTPDPAALAAGTAFNASTMNTMDEYIFSFKLTLKEGDKPTLDLVIRNPYIGLLNPSRLQWAWFSHLDSTGHIRPLFCGRLVAAPKDIFKEQMAIQLVAWPIDYFEQLQAQAEFIKRNGPYDPVFIEVTKRDDPDTVLEAVSGLYHVDPVTHLVTISDITQGEDGYVEVTQDQHLYDKMDVDFDQTTQIVNTLMIADVSWNQTGQGYIVMTPQSIETYSGDSLIGDWPKPLSSVGAGYTVAFSNAVDRNGVASAVTATASYSFTNKEKKHEDGDTMSASFSQTAPSIADGGQGGVVIFSQITPGFMDPFAVDDDGDPQPINQPLKVDVTTAYAGLWHVDTYLTFLYRDLQRTRTERLQMMLTSDLQPILVDPLVTQDSEVITKQGADVSQPILITLNWSTVAGHAVALDTIIFPNDPSLPSQRTAQICIVAGTAGTVEPNFSDVTGAITIDGTVHWASLGTPNPPETAYDWTAVTNVPAGEIILPRKPLFITYAALILPGQQTFPRTSVQVSRGQIVQFPDGNYYACTTPGLAGVAGTSAAFTLIGASLPDGKTHYIAVQGGQTGPEFIIPQFNPTLHAQTTDGTVIWASIGTGDLPIGGTPGDTWGRTYFDTTRGLQSVAYLVAILRARALMKARAVTVSFTPIDPFGLGTQFTCRKNAIVFDDRLAGGLATGKIINVELGCDGSNGQETCHVQMGCCIGTDNVVDNLLGTPVYVSGYVIGYQQYTNGITLVGDNSDVGFTPPQVIPNDDGLVFPLDYSQVVISEAVLGGLGGQTAALGRVFDSMKQTAILSWIQSNSASLDYSFSLARQIQALSAYTINWATSINPIWYDLVLKPLSGLQFNNNCVVKLTKLTAPKGIDLTGASTFGAGGVPPPPTTGGGGGGGGGGGSGDISLLPSRFTDADIIYSFSSTGGTHPPPPPPGTPTTLLPSRVVDTDTVRIPSLSGGSNPFSPFPSAGTTGYSGSLTSTQGATTISSSGTYSNIHFTGPVVIAASNVTLSNCFIDLTGSANSGANYGVLVNSGLTGIHINNSTLTGFGINSTQNQYGVQFGDSTVTVDGCNFSFWGHSLFASGAPNVIVQNCYADRLSNWSGNSHYEHFYIGRCTGSILIQNNTWWNANGWTAVLFIKNDFGPISNVTVQNNYFKSSSWYVTYVDGSGASGGAITNIKYLNNKFQLINDAHPTGQHYWNINVSGVVTSGNTDYISNANIDNQSL